MRKVVLLSLDAMFDRDLSVMGRGAFITGMIQKGVSCTQVKTVFPALTYPAHTTIITGCDPESHGIGQNMPFQPDIEDELRVWYLDQKHIQRETLFDAVQREGGRCASMLWPVTCNSKSIRWNFPEAHIIRGENQVAKMLKCGTAPWILAMELKYGRKRPSTKEPHLSDYAATLTREVIRANKPDLVAAHLIDLDDMRHHHGTDSAQAREALRRLDSRVRDIWETMQKTPGYEEALLVVVSDHGQADVDRSVCLGELLAANDLADCAEIQSNGMTAYLYPGEGDHEKALTWLRNHPTQAGISHIYTREELDELHAVNGPVAAVEAVPGVVFSDMLPEAKREKATHGFGPGHPAENCLFMVMGRGIREGEVLPSMPMRDVAPTIAELMGIQLPQAEGKSHAEMMIK